MRDVNSHLCRLGDVFLLLTFCYSSWDAHQVTTPEEDGPGVALPGAKARLSVVVSDTVDPDRYTFQAIPVHGPRRVWRLEGEVTRGAHGLAITELTIAPDPELAGGITGALMRDIPIGALLDYVRDQVTRTTTSVLGSVAAEAGAAQRRGGRQAISDQLLREVAMLYLDETGPGKAAGAVARIAERYGRPEETIRTWLARSRKAGWLGPSKKGKAGADPGPRLIEETGA